MDPIIVDADADADADADSDSDAYIRRIKTGQDLEYLQSTRYRPKVAMVGCCSCVLIQIMSGIEGL